MPVVEVLSKKGDVLDNHNYNFSISNTNESIVTNFSSYLDNDLSQGKQTRDKILLSVDEISDLLAHDFERYANQSKDACILTCYANSCDEVISPNYDVEEDTILEYVMSSVESICDSN